MRQLTALDAQFLNVESPTTVGHVGSLIVLDPSTAPGGSGPSTSVRDVFEPRLHLAAPLRQRLVEVPLGLGRPYWVDDPHFDLEFHLRELALPSPGTREQLGEQVARIHARPLDRTRPLWEAYVITGLEDGRVAFYSKIHHAAIDGVSGAEILETIMDVTPRAPRRDPGGGAVRAAAAALDARPGAPRAAAMAADARSSCCAPCRSRWSTSTSCPARRTSRAPTCQRAPPGSSAGPSAGRRAPTSARGPARPAHPVERQITPHRRFSFGSLPLADVKSVKNHFGMTVNDVVMALTASALRRWLLDHDALPTVPLVVAVPVSIRPTTGRSNGTRCR